MKCEVEIDVEIPEGYRIKRIGIPRQGEMYLTDGTSIRVEGAPADFQYALCVIVEKDVRWRKASPIEILEEMLRPGTHKLRYVFSQTTCDIQTVREIGPRFATVSEFDGKVYHVSLEQFQILKHEE